MAGNREAGTLKEKLSNGSAKFSTTRVDPDLANELQQYGVKFNGAVESKVLGSLLAWLMPVLLFVGVSAGRILPKCAD